MMSKIILFIILASTMTQGGRWVCGDTHHHTGSSGDVTDSINGVYQSAVLLMQNAIAAGLNFVLVTDHGTMDEYWKGFVPEANRLYADKDHLCLIGEEFNCRKHQTLFGVKPEDRSKISTAGETTFDKWKSAYASVHALGGWLSINHPQDGPDVDTYEEFRQLAMAGMTGFEIFNGGSGWTDSRSAWPVGGWWDSVLTEGFKMIGLAGSDAHGVGVRSGHVRTWVYIDSDSVTEQGIVEGFKKGRVWAACQYYSQFGLCADCFSMDFTVNDSMMGSTIPFKGESLSVHIRAKLDSCALSRVPKLDSVRLVSDGVVIWQRNGNGPEIDTTFKVSSKVGRYLRVEIQGLNRVSAGSILRCFSGPIYLEPGSSTSVLSPKAAASRPTLQVSPNPFNDLLGIQYSTTTVSRAVLKIFSADGRLVAVPASGVHSAGNHSAYWNGLGLDGRPLSAGIYMVSLETDQRKLTRRVLFGR